VIFSCIAWYYGDNYIVTKCGSYAGHKSIHHAHQISVLAHAIRSQTLVPWAIISAKVETMAKDIWITS